LQQSAEVETGVADETDRDGLIDTLEEMADERGFTGAHFARNQAESALTGQAVFQSGQRFAMRRRKYRNCGSGVSAKGFSCSP